MKQTEQTARAAVNILVEARSFAQQGGWFLDPSLRMRWAPHISWPTAWDGRWRMR